MRLNNAFQRQFVGGSHFLGKRGGGNLIEGLNHRHITLARRSPIELGHWHMLFFQVITEHGDTDVNDVQRLVK
ncbi:hypothetical protein D3C75_1193830 [compost metagenome]